MITLYLILTYLISSIPFGVVVNKLFSNEDIRKKGSGNIGATNVARVMGKKFAILVLILDGLKGYIPVIFATSIFKDSSNLSLLVIIIGLTAICGHIFPIYLKFKGGKGVATTIAILFAIDIKIGVIFILSWLLIFLLKRISSLSALGATFLMPFMAIYFQKTFF